MVKSRLEAFSDAIVAIIVTILVLNLPMPKDYTFKSFFENWNVYMVYVANFIIIFGMWLQHHNLFKHVKVISRTTFWANALWLLLQSFIPFLSKWVNSYPYEIEPTITFVTVNMFWLLSYRLIYISLRKDNKLIVYNRKYTVSYIFTFFIIGLSAFYNINITRIMLVSFYGCVVLFPPSFTDKTLDESK